MGGPGGRGTGGRPSSKRPRSHKQSREELEAQAPTTYTPSQAPVPEGEVIIERGSTAQDIAPRLNRNAADVVQFLFSQGEKVTATMSLSDEMIELFAAEIGAKVRLVDPGQQKEAELQARYFGDDDGEGDEEMLRPRPPVVTVMGHVDHGKTTLLDRIRQSDVASSETGGITQHIGAYQVKAQSGALITFIDTPGHEAFTAMRARGAEVTDIVVLVVAADDGVMPQTVEAINHAKAAEVPIVVAINKIDRPDADPNRVMQQLSDLGLVPERWGGDTIMVEVSALQNLGIDELLEQLLVVAEVEELRANPELPARGVVLEANLDPGKGPVATVIVQRGTLRVGDHVVAGAAWGRVKALIDDKGDNVKEAPPSFPAQVLGFDSLPAAGDELRAVPSSRTAREIAEQREQRSRSAEMRRSSAATSGGAKLEDIFHQIQRGETATLNLIVKADVQGSLEAVTESLRKLERDDVKLAFVHRGVGGITENDVALAAASNATIIGFNVRPGREARAMAAAQGVEIRTYEIIYKLIEDVQAAMVGMLAPEYEEVVTGEAEVREIFRIPKIGAIAGCYVRSGAITRGSKVRFLRDGVIIWKGAITSLRRFKEDVREVHEGFECGVGLSNNQDIEVGDIIETYEEREIPRT
jgi:translation initiation factor IF-2